MRGFFEMPPRPQENAPPKKEESFLSKMKKSPMAQAAIVAAGLHVAVPVGIEATRIGVAHARTQQERWHGEGSVLRVQSDAVRDAVASRVQEREKHQDLEKLKAYREKAAERLEKNESVGFEELYFQQAEAKGVPHERIEQAKKAVQGMVEHFSSKLEGGLSDQEIKDISREMFDLAEYEWGQGSVVDYFVDHKRNCVAVAQAETIVFDRLLERLPEDQRGRFHTGRRFENQHQIAVMGVAPSVDAAPERFIILQPPYNTEHSGAHPAGTAMVSDVQLKQALVGKSVKASAVAPRKGEEVESGPRIDALVNQPVDEGIVIEGKLRVANENIREAKKEGIEPMVRQEYEKKFGGMEIEIQFEDPTLLTRLIEDVVRRAKPYELAPTVDLEKVKPPNDGFIAFTDGTFYNVELRFGSLERWSPKALESIVNQQVETISIEVDLDGKIPSVLLKAFQEKWKQVAGVTVGGMPWRTLELRKAPGTQSKDIDNSQFMKLLSTTLHSKNEVARDPDLLQKNYELQLDTDTITDEQFEALRKFPPSAVHITGRMEHLWTDTRDAPNPKERDRLRKGLQSLDVPVYIGLEEIGVLWAGNPVPKKEDFSWMLQDTDHIFPEFNDIISDAVNPNSLNEFHQAVIDHQWSPVYPDRKEMTAKANFIEGFFGLAKSTHGVNDRALWSNLRAFWNNFALNTSGSISRSDFVDALDDINRDRSIYTQPMSPPSSPTP